MASMRMVCNTNSSTMVGDTALSLSSMGISPNANDGDSNSDVNPYAVVKNAYESVYAILILTQQLPADSTAN